MLLFSKRWYEEVERTQQLLLRRLKKIARAGKARLRYRIRDVFVEDFVRRLKATLRLDEPLASPLLQRMTPKALKRGFKQFFDHVRHCRVLRHRPEHSIGSADAVLTRDEEVAMFGYRIKPLENPHIRVEVDPTTAINDVEADKVRELRA
jgi:hypothetical protein